MRKTAVITGASSGIGREFARQIAKDSGEIKEIWLIGRNREKLAETQNEIGDRARMLPLDLTDPKDRERLRDKLKEHKPQIQLLVNAAGMGVIGKTEELPLEPQLQTVRINCEALTAVTVLALPYMTRGGCVIQMGSASGFFPQPAFAVYAASKSYVLSFSRALRQELRPKGVRVTCVCPGPVDTPFFGSAETYHKRMPGKNAFMTDPARVVSQALKDAAAGRDVSVCGTGMRLARLACKVLPHRLLLAVWGRLA